MQRQAFVGASCLMRTPSRVMPLTSSASSRLVLGTVLQRDQRRGLYKTDKLPQIQLRPEPLPDLGPWLELTLVRSTLRKLGLSTRQSVSFQRDIGPIRGMLCSINHLIKFEPVNMERFGILVFFVFFYSDVLRADPPRREVAEAEVEAVEEEEEWVRFKREYMANVAAAVKKKEESEKKAALAAAKEAADKNKKKKKK
ncbi:uncharacterized protein ACA1_046680 [Acanthamoeba castellanii str. Neff]|uniref:Ribosomal protein L30 n=1 Tax=Acanthamoeba castellanii (strain ATCC 30010 / Neff) TaxID=1257118 RepID=L8HB37_ACACF|nr:uncharacterized protein ACA1_046680 [Acanthamoeba castellanii str. Neff]ELR21948.1 hypothetical protein ACA1_046680 [Acanthamoeba castellanii str. Neff]